MKHKSNKWKKFLIILILFLAGYFIFNKFLKDELKQVRIDKSGKITATTKLVVAEQKQYYSRFVDTGSKNEFLNAITLGFLKGKLYFQWESENVYGINITKDNPILWKRLDEPGAIEIISPPIELLSCEISLDPEKYVVLDVYRTLAEDEEKFKEKYREKQFQLTRADALKILDDKKLEEIAKAVIGEHVKNILNQELTTEKIHKAIVRFR
ncbi:MAG: hypothetical protein CR986_06815 [Ignavibacteriae bacterium]|nr:MAG: hypothetical protein CR986_06815 [Ignavibacteriota bacterium]